MIIEKEVEETDDNRERNRKVRGEIIRVRVIRREASRQQYGYNVIELCF